MSIPKDYVILSDAVIHRFGVLGFHGDRLEDKYLFLHASQKPAKLPLFDDDRFGKAGVGH